MNLTLREVRERIDWLLNNTTVMPSARTNVADINLVNGVGREAHFVAADGEGNTIESLLKQVRELGYDLMNEREEHRTLRCRTASVID